MFCSFEHLPPKLSLLRYLPVASACLCVSVCVCLCGKGDVRQECEARWQASGWIFIAFLTRAKHNFLYCCATGWALRTHPFLSGRCQSSISHSLAVLTMSDRFHLSPARSISRIHYYWIECGTAAPCESELSWADFILFIALLWDQSFETVWSQLKCKRI